MPVTRFADIEGVPADMTCPTEECDAPLWQGGAPNESEFPLHCPVCLQDIETDDILDAVGA
jgi:hypothetical protein